MVNKIIPDDVRRFIVSVLPSVPHLEAILLLRGIPGQAWSCAKVAQRLYVSEKIAASVLRDLVASEIISQSEQSPQLYQYAPSSAMLRQAVDALANCYATHLVEITNLIHSKSSKKAHEFANAFKWRKD